MPVSRGDVVLAVLPYSDGSGAKRRPALVVQSDRNNRRLDDVILALITTYTARAAHEATQVLVEIASPDGRQTGLLQDSVVKCEHLITLHQRLVERTIGKLPPTLMQQVDAALKASLQLS